MSAKDVPRSSWLLELGKVVQNIFFLGGICGNNSFTITSFFFEFIPLFDFTLSGISNLNFGFRIETSTNSHIRVLV